MKKYLEGNNQLKTFYIKTQDEVTQLYLKEKEFIRSKDNDGVIKTEQDIN